MLKRPFRSLKASEVTELFQGEPSTVGDAGFRILWKKVNQGFPQFVVITSTKLHRSAVVRNRLRRQLYRLLRLHFSQWTVGVRVAIVVKTPALKCDQRELAVKFLRLLQRAELL